MAREKYEPKTGFEEARAARVVLRPRRALGEIDPAEVRLEVTFIDRDEFTAETFPTRIPLSAPPSLGDTWPAGETKSLEYRYEVPRGFRSGPLAGHTYYGHVVRLYYRGELEDVYAFPDGLLAP